MIFTTKRIQEMTREQINNLVNVSDVESGKKLTETLMKARRAAYQSDRIATSEADNAAINAIIRAVRRDGPLETRKLAIAMAAVQSAVYAERASDSLTDSEYASLVRPLARAIGEPEKRSQAPQQGAPVEDVKEEPSQEELDAFFGPSSSLQHDWERAIKGRTDHYPVTEAPPSEEQLRAMAAQLNAPSTDLVEVSGVAREMESRVAEEEELDLFS